MTYNTLFHVLAVGAIFCSSASVDGGWFLPLPQLPGSAQAGDAFAVSADGSTVVGMSHNGSITEAVHWSVGEQGTVHALGTGRSSIAWGVSADGSVIVGNGSTSRGYPLAFRWTQNAGGTMLGDFSGGEEASAAYDVSSDGSVVVGGGSTAQGGEAFRWTSSTGLVSIGDLPGGILGGSARGVSKNGSVVVGSGVSDNGTEAFRWSAETGMIGLGDLPGGGFFSEAYDVSADGSVVVGRSFSNSGFFPSRAFRWTAEAGMVALPDVPGFGPADIAQGISGDGTVIVGAAIHGDEAVAFAWDAFHGSRSLAEILVSQGVDLDGFELGKANAVSYDGLTIVGSGLPKDSLRFQPWVARLDPGTFIPEPSSLSLSAACFAWSLLLWCRR